VLFVDVPKVVVKIRHRRLTGIADNFDIFDNGRTGENSIIVHKNSVKSTYQSTLLPEPATNMGYYQAAR
jgi:hypothetical protein